MWPTVMSMPLRIFSRLQGQGMAFRSKRTPMGAAFPEKPLRLRMGSCHDSVNPFELAVSTEIFGLERPELRVSWYRFLVCAVEPRPIGCGRQNWLPAILLFK